MTVKTTLSFTDRHHDFLAQKVGEGVFATTSSAVAAAVENMIQDERDREAAFAAFADEIRTRMETPIDQFVSMEEAFRPAREYLATLDDG